jgi:hypothetical protein
MSDEGFLSRWSRRKRAADAGSPPDQGAPRVVPAAPVPVPAEEAPFDIATLPPVESLTLESDITAFLRKEVPAALQRAALRKAWTLDPAIRDFVGPADYAWDYNAPDGVPGASLNLTGDLREMLAQAFGPEPSEEEAVASAPPTAAPAPEAPPAPDVTPPVTLAEAPAATDTEAVRPTGRRHGSALPS